MSNLSMTLSLSAEDRALLERLTKQLEGLLQVDSQRAPDPEPAPEPEPALKATVPEAPAYTMADVQKLVVRLCAAGKKSAVRELIKRYADTVSAIPAEAYPEVMSGLEEISGGEEQT